MTKVMVFGSFDPLHAGHRDMFAQAKAKGNYLIVVVARDQSIKKSKGARPAQGETERLKIVTNEKVVDEATLGYLYDHFKIIKKYRPEVICLGYDQKMAIKELKERLAKFNLTPEIFRLAAYQPEIYKSSIIKKQNGLREK
jgi:FAD synthetase